MNSKTIKTKITKLLKANGFVKSEIKKDWHHPKRKSAGFEYFEYGCNGLGYYIPENVFEEIEKKKFEKEKVDAMFKILNNTDLAQYLTKYEFSITWSI
jgi:hypothetical protein